MKNYITTNDNWREAQVLVQEYCKNEMADKLYYNIDTKNENHCCPPPIAEIEPKHSDEKGTDTLWRGRRIIWCYPANPNEGTRLKTDEKVPVGCLGCAFWNIIHAFKFLKLEDKITNEQMENFKKVSLQSPLGFAQSFADLGWTDGSYFTDPNKARGGDLGVIGYGDELQHHWFVVAEEPHIEVKGNAALNTWSGSPMAGGAGFDYWYKEKKKGNKDRYWILCRPFEDL